MLDLLWGGKTQREAAEAVGVSRRTVQYWVKRPAFRAAWEARAGAEWGGMMESLRRRKSPAGSAAMERSWETMTAPYCKASRRVNAARLVLAEALRLARRRL